MENGHRLVDDLLTAAADEVREIIILRQTLPPRLGDHADKLAPQIAGADAFDLLLEIDATVPNLERRKFGERCDVGSICLHRRSRHCAGLLLVRSGVQRRYGDAGCKALQVDGEIHSRQRLVKVVDIEQDVVLGRHEGAEIHQVAVATGLHRKSGHRLAGQICRHDRKANGLSIIRL